MKQWFSRFFLLTGLTLLLYHNVISHHHDDEDEPTEHAQHHPDDALEHVKIDHEFFQSHQQYFTVDLIAVIISQVFRLREPVVITLPQTAWIKPEEPYPPTQHSDQTILRGPPSNC